MTSKFDANEQFRELLAVDDPGLAQRLREFFGIARSFGLDLATTVVPVVSIDVGQAPEFEPTGGAQVGSWNNGITNLVSVIGVRNLGSSPVVVTDIYAAVATAAGRGKVQRMTTAMTYDFGSEAQPLFLRDSRVSYPGVTGIIGHVAAAQLPTDWNVDGTSKEIQLGGSREYRRHVGPWFVNPGERLFVHTNATALELLALFAIE